MIFEDYLTLFGTVQSSSHSNFVVVVETSTLRKQRLQYTLQQCCRCSYTLLTVSLLHLLHQFPSYLALCLDPLLSLLAVALPHVPMALLPLLTSMLLAVVAGSLMNAETLAFYDLANTQTLTVKASAVSPPGKGFLAVFATVRDNKGCCSICIDSVGVVLHDGVTVTTIVLEGPAFQLSSERLSCLFPLYRVLCFNK